MQGSEGGRGKRGEIGCKGVREGGGREVKKGARE